MTVDVRSEWTTVNGRRMHARASGNVTRAPLVLVHGLGVSSLYFVRLMRSFGEDFHVLAPDLPGFGRSDAPDHTLSLEMLADELRAWMDARGLQRPILLGNSMGCQVLINLAVAAPSRIGKLVLVGPTVDPRFRTFGRQLPRWLIEATHEPLGIFPILLSDYARCGVQRFLVTARFALDDRPEDKLPAIAAPTLVVRGERDAVVSHAWAKQVTSLLVNGRLATVRAAPHAAHHSAPSSVARLVEEFVRKSPSRRHRPATDAIGGVH